MVDSCRSKLAYIVTGVPEGSVWPCYFPHVLLGAVSILENNLIGYADDQTLITVEP